MEISFETVAKSLEKYIRGTFWGFIISGSMILMSFLVFFISLFGPKLLKTYLEGPSVEELKSNIESAKSFLD